MIAVEERRSEKPGPDKQERVVLLGIESDQRHDADHERKEGRGDFHIGVNIPGAAPFNSACQGITQDQRNADHQVNNRPFVRTAVTN